MAEAVDDTAEAVDVDRQHGEAELAVALGAFDRVRQPVGEQLTVGKPGERVAEGRLLELVGGALEDADAGAQPELGAERRGELAEELDFAIGPDARRIGEDAEARLRRAVPGLRVVARLLERDHDEGVHAVIEARYAAFGPLDERVCAGDGAWDAKVGNGGDANRWTHGVARGEASHGRAKHGADEARRAFERRRGQHIGDRNRLQAAAFAVIPSAHGVGLSSRGGH